MTKRGGHTTRGGRGTQKGRDQEANANLGNGNLQISSQQPDPIPEANQLSNVNQSQSTYQQPDMIGETEQQSASGHMREKRGITCGIGARKAMRATNKRLTVEFNFAAQRVTCGNASAFMYECGYILRKNCSLQYKEWRLVPSDVRKPLRHKLLTLFNVDVEDPNVCKVIDTYMAKAWRGYRSDLHCYFKKIGGEEDLNKAKTTPPPDLANQEDWEYLCNMWSQPKYKETAEKRIMAREKRKMDSRNGSKSTIRYHIERGLDLGSSTGQLETWRSTHWDSTKGWISTDAAAKYEQMLKLRNENSVDSMSDKAIMEKVLGRSSVRLSGWGRDPVASKTTSTNESNRPTYNQLVDRIQFSERRNAKLEKILIEKNILPPSGLSEDDIDDISNHVESGEPNDDFGGSSD